MVGNPFAVVNLALPQLPQAADTATGRYSGLEISHLFVSLRQGTFGFKSGLGGVMKAAPSG